MQPDNLGAEILVYYFLSQLLKSNSYHAKSTEALKSNFIHKVSCYKF